MKNYVVVLWTPGGPPRVEFTKSLRGLLDLVATGDVQNVVEASVKKFCGENLNTVEFSCVYTKGSSDD